MQTFTTVEARSEQQSQKNTSTFSALLVAGILHAVLVAGLAIWYLAGPEPREPELIISAPVGESLEKVQSKDFSTVVKEAPAASSSQMAMVSESGWGWEAMASAQAEAPPRVPR